MNKVCGNFSTVCQITPYVFDVGVKLQIIKGNGNFT